MSPRLITFYLPQFHPIPENDEWWGAGFTEWTNVAQAKPRFTGHHQPHIPADLGFYDLRLPETRSAQAALAKRYGIHGFCYYHYWFNGSMLLQRPLNEVLSSGSPDFPFCVCWANESWSRAWDGLERQLLKKQEYNEEDHLRHIEWLINVFRDSRYIRVDGKPVMVIYRINNIPDGASMIRLWRQKVAEAGLPGLYLCGVRTLFTNQTDQEIINLGVDALIDFQPNREDFPPPRRAGSILYEVAKKVLPDSIYQKLKLTVTASNRVNYRDMVDAILSKPWPRDYVKLPGIFPTWDNSARRKSALIIQNDNPKDYEHWLKGAIERVNPYPAEQQLIFINAWNEWAEGCHLEPDRKNGHGFLQATADALRNSGLGKPAG